jgi:hypothetical protein
MIPVFKKRTMRQTGKREGFRFSEFQDMRGQVINGWRVWVYLRAEDKFGEVKLETVDEDTGELVQLRSEWTEYWWGCEVHRLRPGYSVPGWRTSVSTLGHETAAPLSLAAWAAQSQCSLARPATWCQPGRVCILRRQSKTQGCRPAAALLWAFAAIVRTPEPPTAASWQGQLRLQRETCSSETSVRRKRLKVRRTSLSLSVCVNRTPT